MHKYLWVFICVVAFFVSGCALNQSKNNYSKVAYSDSKITTTRDGKTVELTSKTSFVKHTQPTTEENLWHKIAEDIDIVVPNRAIYAQILRRYANNQSFFDRVSRNADYYLHYVVQEIKARNMPLFLSLLPIIESDYKAYAVSHAGAAGAWQIIPSTADLLGIKQNWWFDGRLDIVHSTDGALTYLEKMYDRFGDWKLALAAYNCGPYCVSKAIKKNRRRGRSIRFEDLPLPRETRHYVPKLFAISKIIQNPSFHGIDLPLITNKKKFDVVYRQQQLSLVKLATDLDIDVNHLYALNSGYKNWVTEPDDNAHIIVPAGLKEKSKQIISGYNSKTIWQRYFLAKNQTIDRVAEKDNLSLKDILEVNDISAYKKAKRHQVVLIPVHQYLSSSYENYFKNKIKRFTLRNTKQYYRVRNGDSLWTISMKHNISVKKLKKLNNIYGKSYIHPGDRVKLYNKKGFQYAKFTFPYKHPLNNHLSSFVK